VGIENNECVIAITADPNLMKKIRTWVRRLNHEDDSLFTFVPALANGKETVIMAPDGSKKGWGTSKFAQKLREKFIKKIQDLDSDPNFGGIQWVEVGFGDFGQKVLQGNNNNIWSDEEYATL
jgi:hypothetical protein